MSALAFFMFSFPLKVIAMSDTPDEVEVRSIQDSPRTLIIKGRQSIIAQQLHILGRSQDGFFERDMIVIKIAHPDYLRPDEDNAPQTEIVSELTQLEFRSDALSLYDEYIENLKGDNKLTIKLIGKDGRVKTIWDRLIDDTRLFRVIDAMPMRQNELRSSG